jgi:hypothetical protein
VKEKVPNEIVPADCQAKAFARMGMSICSIEQKGTEEGKKDM